MENERKTGATEPAANMEERILEAAGKLFIEKGFGLTSTTEIARAAGCNQALVHYYYRTKENLFRKFVGNKVREFFSEFMKIETEEKDFIERLKILIGFHYDLLRANSDMVLFLVGELTRTPEFLDEIIREMGPTASRAKLIFEKDLQAEIDSGRIRQTELVDLIINVLSLNIFLFIAKPLFGKVWGVEEDEMEVLLDHRKEEIIKTIMLTLRP